MSDANKALAEVRGWLCDNLGSGDAGKVCGMLSVVSRHINEIEDENAKLREFAQAMAEVAYEGQMLCDKCRFSHGCYSGGKKEHEGRGCQWLLWARELGIEARHV